MGFSLGGLIGVANFPLFKSNSDSAVHIAPNQGSEKYSMPEIAHEKQEMFQMEHSRVASNVEGPADSQHVQSMKPGTSHVAALMNMDRKQNLSQSPAVPRGQNISEPGESLQGVSYLVSEDQIHSFEKGQNKFGIAVKREGKITSVVYRMLEVPNFSLKENLVQLKPGIVMRDGQMVGVELHGVNGHDLASLSGYQKGDIIRTVNGEKLDNLFTVPGIVVRSLRSMPVYVDVERAGKIMTVRINQEKIDNKIGEGWTKDSIKQSNEFRDTAMELESAVLKAEKKGIIKDTSLEEMGERSSEIVGLMPKINQSTGQLLEDIVSLTAEQ